MTTVAEYYANYYQTHKHEFYGEYGNDRLSELLRQRVKPIDTDKLVLGMDIGACIGEYQININAIVSESNRKFYSFEPNPANLPRLRANVSTIVKDVAVSDIDSESGFFCVENTNNHESYGLGGLRSGGSKICEVKVKRMDTILDEENIPDDCIIKFVKIDTEGNDGNVIKGFGRYINNVKYIIFECSNCLDDCRGPGIENPMKDIVDYLSKNGFDTYRIGTERLIKVNDEYFHQVYENEKYWSNCFAIKKEDEFIHELIDSEFKYIK